MPSLPTPRTTPKPTASLLTQDGTPRFVALQHVATSARYDIARGVDATTQAPTALKAPQLDDARDACLALEVDALATEDAALPSGGAVVFVTPDAGTAAHPVIAMPWVSGKRLDRYVAENGPTGLAPSAAIGIVRDVHGALAALHAAGFVHRRVCPEHILVRPDGRATLIGLSHATRKSSAHPGGGTFEGDPYAAPEIQRELSGRFNTPRADVYALGMVLAYAATGERPTGNVSAPLTRTGFLRLYDQPEGIGLLIGRCTQPLQKNRIGMRTLGEWLRADALPTRTTPGFGPLELIAAWAARDPADMAVSTLSPGPLVNRSATALPASEPEAPTSEPPPALPESAPVEPAPVEPVAIAPASRLPRLALSVAVLAVGLALAWLRLRGR